MTEEKSDAVHRAVTVGNDGSYFLGFSWNIGDVCCLVFVSLDQDSTGCYLLSPYISVISLQSFE